jgi:hypothetical protein
MHRSGTSAFSGMLSDNGVYFGNNLIVGNEYNKKGFFEQSEVVLLNERILDATGFTWDDVGLDALDSLPPIRRLLLKHQIRALVRSVYADHPMPAIKDPRLSLFVGFWREALGNRFPSTSVIVVRSPDEVVRSLSRRNHFPPEKSALLWLTYNVACIQNTADTPRHLLFFEDIMKQPDRALSELSDALGLPLRLGDQAQTEFLEKGLRHHVAESPSSRPPDAGPAESTARRFYDLLRSQGLAITTENLAPYQDAISKLAEMHS